MGDTLPTSGRPRKVVSVASMAEDSVRKSPELARKTIWSASPEARGKPCSSSCSAWTELVPGSEKELE